MASEKRGLDISASLKFLFRENGFKFPFRIACERRRIFSVTGSAENNVCEPELENDFCDVGILSQSHFSSEKPRTTARGIRASQENKVQQQWRIMWMLLSVKY